MNENEQPQDAEVDQLLGRWAERRQSTKNLDQLHEQIMSAWYEEGAQAPDPRVSPHVTITSPRQTIPARLVWFALGAAAAVIIVLGMSTVLDEHGSKVIVSTTPDSVWLPADQVAEKAKLLREMERVFENRLEWVAETDGRVLLEVRQGGLGESRLDTETGVAVRVVVVRRSANQPHWKPVWAVDLVARQEQVIRLTPESAALPEGAELSLWAYAADEEMVAVDSNLTLAGLPVESTFSGMQQSGKPTVVHSVEESGVEYQVFQTVAILNNSEV